MITIVDLGIGNVGSLENMLARSKIPFRRTSVADVIAQSSQLILPGVGAFDAGMERIHHLGIQSALQNALAEKNASILGICLGMQMLCEKSEEGKLPGLGLIPAIVKRLPLNKEADLKVPHMGWNTVRVKNPDSFLFNNLVDGNRFYFVHSYGVVCGDPLNILGTTEYGGNFCSSIYSKKIFGVQFHPEKSHKFGKLLLENFFQI